MMVIMMIMMVLVIVMNVIVMIVMVMIVMVIILAIIMMCMMFSTTNISFVPCLTVFKRQTTPKTQKTTQEHKGRQYYLNHVAPKVFKVSLPLVLKI